MTDSTSIAIALPSTGYIHELLWRILVNEGVVPAPLKDCRRVPLTDSELDELEAGLEKVIHPEYDGPFLVIPLYGTRARDILNGMKDREIGLHEDGRPIFLFDQLIWAHTDEEDAAIAASFRDLKRAA